ncbi:MAG: hypothetical protein ACRC34_00065 [Cetobacterium sp.]
MKIITLFLLICSLLKADYLITNGEIALFYDKENNILKDVKTIEKTILSNFQINLLKDYKIYEAKNYYVENHYIDGINIFYLKYFIENKELEVYILLSNKNKNNVYIYTKFDKLNWKIPFKLVYKFSPINLDSNIQNKNDYYKYDSLNILKDKNSELFVSTENDFQNFKMKTVDTELKKELNERLYLVKNITPNLKDDILKISLKKDIPEFDSFDFNKILSNEILFWKNFDKRYENLRKNVINQIKNFSVISTNNFAKNRIRVDISRINYMNGLKIKYLNYLLNKEKNIEFDFFKEDKLQNIYTYYYYLKILTVKNNFIIQNKVKVFEDVLEMNESILNKEGQWLDNSVVFYNFLIELKNKNILFESTKDLESIKNDIQKKVKNEIFDSSDRLKSYEYIKYIEILTDTEQKIRLKELQKELKNSSNLLQTNSNIDISANLNLALLLYKNNYVVESDKIFYNIDYFINNKNVTNNLNLEETFLYLLNIHYRGLI